MICNALCVLTFVCVLGVFSYIHCDLYAIKQALFPQILLDPARHSKEYNDDYELVQQCGGVPPPMIQPEALTLHQRMSN